jgi:hypothetical protein
MTVATKEDLDESFSARIVRQEPVSIQGFRKNVECICGLVRYDMYLDCPCGLGFTSIRGYRVAKKEETLIGSTVPAKTRFWYHATAVENWENEVKKAHVPVHIGNSETAHQRAADTLQTGATYYLYKMVLNPFASISETICPDLGSGWSETVKSFSKIAKADFVRYVNNYENSGSVSLYGNPNKFIVVSKTSHKVSTNF